jgi:hypothetical protein
MSRHTVRETGGDAGRKLLAYAVVIAIVIWAARNPHQAAAVLHAIGTAIATHTAHAPEGTAKP